MNRFVTERPESPPSVARSKLVEEIENYVENSKKKSEMERTELAKEKTGVFSGLYAINPATQKEIPIWISDFVPGAWTSLPARASNQQSVVSIQHSELIIHNLRPLPFPPRKLYTPSPGDGVVNGLPSSRVTRFDIALNATQT